MSARQDRYTFFGVLAAVVIVVLGYLQLGQLYPLTGRGDDGLDDTQAVEDKNAKDEEVSVEGKSQP